MPPRLNNTKSPLTSALPDAGYFRRLSSLECSVAVMLVFGVGASIVQPIIGLTHSSLTHSAERLDDAFRRAKGDAAKSKAATREHPAAP